ncbi:TPA: hypothetical protein HA246_06175 [Candidatus Woesearchaeota archaeon]|nr:hypothetical protein [Candidatus Woesearchaeota archaeon]
MNTSFVLKIIKLYSTDISLAFTILEISKKSRLSYNAAHRTVQALVKQGILSIKKIGPVSQVSLVKNPTSYSYLMLANADNARDNDSLVKKIEGIWERKEDKH